jgi:hypothetical protein
MPSPASAEGAGGDAPADMVDGHDPAFRLAAVRLTGRRCTCGYQDIVERMENHLRFAHPACRNPEIGCQEPAPWDHERWCFRPKGHEGDHWTPSFNGGRAWPARG